MRALLQGKGGAVMERKYDYACSSCLSDDERLNGVGKWEQIHFSPYSVVVSEKQGGGK